MLHSYSHVAGEVVQAQKMCGIPSFWVKQQAAHFLIHCTYLVPQQGLPGKAAVSTLTVRTLSSFPRLIPHCPGRMVHLSSGCFLPCPSHVEVRTEMHVYT